MIAFCAKWDHSFFKKKKMSNTEIKMPSIVIKTPQKYESVNSG